MTFQKTFDELNLLEESTVETKVIDLEASDREPNFTRVDNSGVDVTMVSAIKPGIVVKTRLTNHQTKKVLLDPLEMKLIDEIYDSNTSLKLSHKSTNNTLFNQEFNITLTNGGFGESRQSTKSESEHKNSKPQKKKTEENPLSKNSRDGDLEERHFSFVADDVMSKILNSLDSCIRTDGPTKEILRNQWLPSLKKIEKYRIKYGVCPIYFSVKRCKSDSYFVDFRKSKKMKPSSLDGDERNDNDDKDDDDYKMKSPIESSKDVQKKNPNKTTKRDPYKNVENTDGVWTMESEKPAYSGEEFFEDEKNKGSKFKSELVKPLKKSKKNGKGKNTRFSSVTDVVKSTGSVDKNHIRSMVPEINDWSKHVHNRDGETQNDQKIGSEAIYDANNQHRAESQNTGTSRASGANVGNLTQYSYPDPHYINSTNSKELEKFESLDRRSKFSVSGKPTQSAIESKLKRGLQSVVIHSPSNDKILPAEANRLDDDGDVNKRRDNAPSGVVFKKRKSGDGSAPVLDSRSVRGNGDGRPTKKMKLSAMEREIKHFVPVVPPIEYGFIETYWDFEKNRRGYFWVWSASDNGSRGIEPFMGWIVFDEPTGNKFQSDVSTMIPMYQELQLAKKAAIDRSNEEADRKYVVEKTESKVGFASDDILSGANYIPMMTGQTTNERGARSSLNLNEAELMARERESLYPPHLRDTRPRGYLSEYGFNSKPHWDQGRLLDSRSEAYRRCASYPNFNNPLRSNGWISGGMDRFENTASRSFNMKTSIQNDLMHRDQLRMEALSEMNSLKIDSLLERRTVKTPAGTFIFLNDNEKITPLDKTINAKTVESSVIQMQHLKNEFEHLGSVMGGSPNSILSRNEKGSGSGKDGIFTTKHTQSTSNYGLNISEPMLSPSEQYKHTNLFNLRSMYSRLVSELFKVAYEPIFQDHEKWYRRAIQKHLSSVLTDVQKNDRVFLKNLEFPTFSQNFKVVVTFLSKKTTVDAGMLLDLYKLKFYTAEEVFLELSSNQSNNNVHDGSGVDLQRIVDKSKEDTYSYENKLKRFEKGLNEALEHDKMLGLKEPSGKEDRSSQKKTLTSDDKKK